jgi:hypothetical protein
MKSIIFSLVFVFAIYFAEARGPVVVAKRDVLAQADLLAKLAGLLGKSGGIIAELEKNGKPLLAAGIRKVEDILKGLEEKVKNANPHTELGKLALKGLDELIILAEHQLEAEINKLEGKIFAKRDILGQADLLAKLAGLLGKSGGIIAELEKNGKPLLAAGIRKVEDLLKGLEEKVKNINPHSELGKLALMGLDELIILAEHELEAEIKKLEGKTFAKRDVLAQADLLAKLAGLLGKSGGIIAELEKNGKPLLAAGIRKVEDILKGLEEKVKNANPHTELGKLALMGLDELIILAEHQLEAEIKKLEGTKVVAKRAVLAQADLLLKLAELLSKSKLVQDLLEKEGKPLLAFGLKKIDDLLHSLDAKVRSANPNSEIGKLILKGLDWLIVEAEHKLEDEIKKIEAEKKTGYYEVDVKDGLLKLAQSLRESAKKAIDFLKAEGKSIEAGELELLESVVGDIEMRLETLHPQTEIGKLLLVSLEGLLKNAETKLEEVIKKIDAHP